MVCTAISTQELLSPSMLLRHRYRVGGEPGLAKIALQ
jgi:hypothetical protein